MIKFFLSSISTFDAIAFVVLLLATIAAAWKATDKIRPVGKLIEAIFMTSISVQCLILFIRIYDWIAWGNVAIQTEFCDDFRALASVVILAAMAYIINNILYIIRIPRL